MRPLHGRPRESRWPGTHNDLTGDTVCCRDNRILHEHWSQFQSLDRITNSFDSGSAVGRLVIKPSPILYGVNSCERRALTAPIELVLIARLNPAAGLVPCPTPRG